MQISTIKFSKIEDRIDAEYYKPEYLEVEELFSRIKSQPKAISLLNTLNYIKGYAFESEQYIKEGSIGIYRVSNIENGINFDDIVKAPDFFWEKFKRFRIKPEDIIITVTGNTVGKAMLMPDEIPQLLMNQNAAIWRTKEKVSQFYLYIFVIAKPFQTKIERIARAGTRPFIGVDILKETFICIPPQSFQQEIEKMVKEAQKKRKLADERYKKAEEILNKEIGFKDLDLSTQKTFEAKFSEAEDRIDSAYYQPKYKKIISKLKFQKSKLLGEIVKIRKGIEVGHEAYTTDGVPFVRVQDYDEKEIAVSGNTNYIRPYLYEELKKNHKPMPGEIIYSKDGTVGRAFVVPKDNHEFIVSGGILILTPHNIDNYYLASVLNSPIVKSQANRESIGAIIQHLSIEEIKSLKIPILPQSLQQKIFSLIQGSFKLRQEAKELIDRAKKEVEKMIEKK